MIRVEGLTKAYEGQLKTADPAVADLSFDNETGKFLTLLGPSGCGKSTTLRCIAGLETPDAGIVEIGGKVVFSARRRIDLSPANRRIGMVFQSYAIWPHMNVLDNVAYPLRFRSMTSTARRKRAHEVLEIVGLAGMADRPAPRLSGGQQQRVALARALVGEPEVLLLDEPLSNLDTALRRELGGYVRQLQQDLGLTVIYVTHDQGEAISMSDSIALMDRGRIAERGEPVEMYARPRTRFAASFLGDANYLPVETVEARGGETVAITPEGPLGVSAPDTAAAGPSSPGPQSVMIRPEAIRLAPSGQPDPAGRNGFDCEVLARRYFGMHWEYRLRTPGGWELTAKSAGVRPVEPGSRIRASVPYDECALVSDEGVGSERSRVPSPDEEEADPAGPGSGLWLVQTGPDNGSRDRSRTNEEMK